MLRKIFDWFFRRTVDDAVKGIVKKIEELERIAVAHIQDATAISSTMQMLEIERTLHESESVRATKIAQKIKHLLD